MPSVTLTNVRGQSATATSLPELNHLLRRGFTPDSGTVMAASAQFDPSVATQGQALEQYTSDTLKAAFELPPVTIPRRGKAQRVLTGFQAGHGWTSGGGWSSIDLNHGSTLDPTTYRLGFGRSVYAVTNGTGAGNFLASPAFTALDLSGHKTFGMWVYITSNVANLATLSLYFGSAADYTASYVIQAATPNQLPTNQWVLVTFSAADATVAAGAPAWTSIVAARIRMADNAGGQVTLRFGGIVLNPAPTVLTTGCVSFCQDDSLLSGYQILGPMLARYGFPATAFTITDQIDQSGRITTGQLRELHDDLGWAISAHSYILADHAAGFSTLSPAALDANLRMQRIWLRSNGFTRGVDITAYPLSDHNAAVRAAVRNYFAAAYTTSNFPRSPLPFLGERMQSKRLMIDATTTTGAVTAEVDKAKAGPYHLVIGWHDVVASGAAGTSSLTATAQTVVDYVASSGIPVRTLDDVLRTEP